MRVIAIHICLLLAAAGAAAQTTRVVDDDGQGTAANCDDPQAAFSTVGAAIAAATAGDTVLVCPGTYVENINFGGKAIAVRSAGGPAVTILDGNLADSVVTFASGEGASSSLEGFTIRNGRSGFDTPGQGHGGGVRIANSSPVVRGNVIVRNRSCEGSGISISFGSPLVEENTIAENFRWGCTGGTGGGGIRIGGSSPAVIRRNIIRNNTGMWSGGGIELFSAGAPTIEFNLIAGNSAEFGGGIALYNDSNANVIGNVIVGNQADEGGGIFWLVPSGARGILLVSNTIAGNDSPEGSGIHADGFDGNAAVYNNIIVAAPGQTAVFCNDFYDGIAPVFRSNNVFSATGAAYGGICGDQTGLNGNISADPVFVDPAAGDYHLGLGSPAIDAGQNDASGVPATDIDGHTRVLDGNSDGVGRVDIGADETAMGAPAPLPGAFGKVSPADGVLEQPLTLALRWGASDGATSYELCYDTLDNNTCDGIWLPAWNRTSATVTGLTGGTMYFWHVRATNSAGTTYADGDGFSFWSLTTTVPPITRIIGLSGDLAFGTVPVGSSQSRVLTIRNTGNAPLTISNISYPAGFSASWTGTIPAGELQTVSVRYSPTAPGTNEGTIVVAADHTGGTNTIAVSGTAVSRVLGLSGDLVFGNVVIGAPATRTLTISNSGTVTLTVFGISYPTGFSGAWNGTIAPGTSRDVTVAFIPTAISSYSGTVFISCDCTSGTRSMAVSGAGILAQPVVTAHPSSIAVFARGAATFRADATGAAPLGVGWQRRINAGAAWSDIPGATGLTYTLTAQLSDSGHHFRAVFSNIYGTANTNAAVLTTRSRVRGDFDGDGRAELAVWRPSSGNWRIGGHSNPQLGLSGDVPVPGDYDGNGSTDVAVYRPSTGEWLIAAQPGVQWGLPSDVPVPADYDGDGKIDPAVFRQANGVFASWHVRGVGAWSWGLRGDIPIPADFDGDGKADLAVFRPGTGTWYVVYSTSSYTTTDAFQWGLAGDSPVPADYDGDGKADLAVFRPSTGQWFLRYSASNYATSGGFTWGEPGDVPVPQDTDGDGLDDLVVFRSSNATWWTFNRIANTTSFVQYGASGEAAVMQRPQLPSVRTTDVDGDGQSDVTVFRPGDGQWFTRRSSGAYGTFSIVQWGVNGDVPVAGDYDGDRRMDRAVYRPASGTWFLLLSRSELPAARIEQWGLSSDRPVPADYDGDGRTDLAVYRPSTGQWFVRQSRADYATSFTVQWGLPTDIPVPADYDGDGRADLAVYRPSSGEWFLKLSTTVFGAIIVKQWGLPTDTPAPGDYDGDGRADLAVYRPASGEWFVRDAVTSLPILHRQWGLPGDAPAPRDYDGDGKADTAVFQPSTGEWFVIRSSDGGLLHLQWGLPADIPIGGSG